ncbi:hypothetical protein SEA_OCTOBIEN14_81 [Gordonia phage Octobien14]|uniref:Uncharacterized protein n=1 Tax=Gordonia phage Octobien14 TaxID=2483673 RepID=A0A3G3M9Y9_9CAUD|nr:hypothetical protein L3Y22_gp081 [Gordonia phage Octobien14]AYR03225.1 hypothetical protein SEA_OCTOBIEN14_81 [Gordonia phage Octobien14]
MDSEEWEGVADYYCQFLGEHGRPPSVSEIWEHRTSQNAVREQTLLEGTLFE